MSDYLDINELMKPAKVNVDGYLDENELLGRNPDGPWSRGMEQAKTAAKLSTNLVTGDNESAAKNLIDSIEYRRKNPGIPEGKDLSEAWQRGDEITGGIKEVGGEIAKDWREAPDAISALKGLGRNARAMGEGIVEQVPNMFVPTAGMVAGGVAGSPAGPWGIAGGAFVGASAGNASVEAPEIAMGSLQNANVDMDDHSAITKYLQENSNEILKKAGIKGAVIGAIDTAMTALTGGILNQPAKVATARILGELGVDLTDKVAVKSAIQTPVFMERLGTDAAYQAAQKGMGNVARNVGAASLDPIGEGAGEYLGTGLATGEYDAKNAALEAFSSIGQSAGMFAGQKAYQYATKPGQTIPADPAGTPIDPNQQQAPPVATITPIQPGPPAPTAPVDPINQDIERAFSGAFPVKDAAITPSAQPVGVNIPDTSESFTNETFDNLADQAMSVQGQADSRMRGRKFEQMKADASNAESAQSGPVAQTDQEVIIRPTPMVTGQRSEPVPIEIRQNQYGKVLSPEESSTITGIKQDKKNDALQTGTLPDGRKVYKLHDQDGVELTGWKVFTPAQATAPQAHQTQEAQNGQRTLQPGPQRSDVVDERPGPGAIAYVAGGSEAVGAIPGRNEAPARQEVLGSDGTSPIQESPLPVQPAQVTDAAGTIHKIVASPTGRVGIESAPVDGKPKTTFSAAINTVAAAEQHLQSLAVPVATPVSQVAPQGEPDILVNPNRKPANNTANASTQSAPTAVTYPRLSDGNIENIRKISKPLVNARMAGFSEDVGESLGDGDTFKLMVELLQSRREKGQVALIGDSAPSFNNPTLRQEIQDAWGRILNKPVVANETPVRETQKDHTQNELEKL